MKQEGSKKSWIWGKNSRPKRWIQYCPKQSADLFFKGFREHSRVKTFNFILLTILLFSIFVANNRLAIFVGSNWNFKRKNYFLENSFLLTQIKNNWFYPWYPIARSAAKECCWKQQKEHVDQKHDVIFINKKEKYFQNKKLVFRGFCSWAQFLKMKQFKEYSWLEKVAPKIMFPIHPSFFLIISFDSSSVHHSYADNTYSNQQNKFLHDLFKN